VGEAAVQRLHLEPGDVEKAEPFVLRRPPQRTLRTVVTGDVDPVLAHRVPERVRHRFLLALAIEVRGDVVVEGQGVPGEPPLRPERDGDALEGAPPVGPGRQVQQRTERAVDQPRWLVEGQVMHVTFAQVEVHAHLGRAGPRLSEHGRRGVDADHSLAGSLRDRDRDPPVPDRELHQRPIGRTGELDVEGDVGRHLSRPLLVPVGEPLVPGQ